MIAACGGAASPIRPMVPTLSSKRLSRHLALADEAATIALARRIGLWLRPGDVLALCGDLGSGKTTFARALIQSLQAHAGALEAVPSPTFTLVQIYRAGHLSLWHFDLYRLAAPEEALRMWPVSTAVNRVQSDGPELLRAVELPATLGLA